MSQTKPLPKIERCFYCRKTVEVVNVNPGAFVKCTRTLCLEGPVRQSSLKAINEHNRISKAVREAKK